MNIKENVIKHYLSNCYFILGTAYAGKSTTCKALAEKYDMIHCEENYNSNTIFSLVNGEDQPNLNYFNVKDSWEAYIMRSPEETYRWNLAVSRELISFELAELISLSKDKKVIVDTNIPLEVLQTIADYHQIAIMLSPPIISSSKFFEREDPEKKFLRNQIDLCQNPRLAYKNFIEWIRYGNAIDYQKYIESDCFTINRGFESWLSLDETVDTIAKHFMLETTER